MQCFPLKVTCISGNIIPILLMKKLKPSISFESHPVSKDKAKNECADMQDFPLPPDRLSPLKIFHSDFIVVFSLIKAPSY